MNSFIANISEQEAVLGPEESLHCCKVLRKKPGDTIQVIDGKGWFYEATLLVVSEKVCRAQLQGPGREQIKRHYYLHLAIAPTKQIDRTEWLLEKAVELGVDEISLLRCHNSERTHVNTDRMRKIIESAVKQSLQARLPQLNAMIDFDVLIKENGGTQKLIAHCEPGEKLNLRGIQFKNQSTLVLIGPEGDFSPQEIQNALNKGFKALSLGDNRLRTETAGLAVVQAAFLLS
ncbi:MAG: 16S rRNA (uracil(1498)-N(3))-methyltransferase [Bacteroidia bacterium]|nr:16S rRNA (uracil(1498)-N(3))-methyltransferase [Bacteroidia bacterium]